MSSGWPPANRSLIPGQWPRSSSACPARPESDRQLAGLSPQEQRILGHIAQGKTNRQFAAEMFLAENTVKNYITTLLRKLGMTSRTEAAIYATKLKGQR